MSDIILYKEDIDRLNEILQSLVHETRILSAVLVNKDTRLLAHQGSLALFDMSALAALIVGSYASTQGIAGIIGEKEFGTMSHCGRTKNLLITLIDNDTILAAIFDRQITLSSVSSSIARHVEALRKALLTIKNNMETMFGPDPMSMPSFSNDDVDQGFNSFLNGTSSHTPQHQEQTSHAHAAVATQTVQQHQVAASTPETQQHHTKAPEYVQVRSHQNTSPIQQEHHQAASGVTKYKPAPQMPNHSPKTENSSQQHKVPASGNTAQFSVSEKNYKKPAEQAESQQANKGLFSRMFNKGK